jgi:hypothetical protein
MPKTAPRCRRPEILRRPLRLGQACDTTGLVRCYACGKITNKDARLRVFHLCEDCRDLERDPRY